MLQLDELKQLDVTHFIQFGSYTNKGTLKDEAGCVEKLGMSYSCIQVEFDNLIAADLIAFCKALQQHDEK